ncbi:MAG: glycosyltransferase family 2 protein [Candidatus Levybacteria bacterium]|nr:glycosyltransferase family 2 protein [Candidatus Levybacteria bacterium]
MTKLSVVISAYNAQDKIEDCLKSVQFADEIILVNNSSIDKTVEIAKKYTSKIFDRPNNPMLNVNKNYGFSKASGEWILCLDDDERITPELRDEVKLQISTPIKSESNLNAQNINGYFIPRRNIIFGKWIKHAGWYPDPQLRLFKRTKGKFEEKHVHEMVKVTGEVDYLKEHILHYNYQTISQFLHKMSNIYVPNEAKVLISKGYKANFADAIKFPLKEFLTRFFAQEGYKDGFHGIMLSLLMAFYHFCVFAFVWEEQGFPEIEQGNILDKSKREMAMAGKELKFWLINEKIKNTTNPVKRIFYKAFYRK